MANIYSVIGEWAEEDSTWRFKPDKQVGGKMLIIKDDCSHEELLRMVQEDFNIGASAVDMGYMLPTPMLSGLPTDSPPVFITNDKQVRSMVALSGTHIVRLCVSCKRQTEDVNANRKAAEAGEAADDSGVEKEAYRTADAHNSEYGRVKHEEEAGEIYASPIKSTNSQVGNGMSWELRETYSSKEELKQRLRMLSVEQKFSLKIKKSTKTLFVAVCRVQGCKWRVRATPRDSNSEIMYIRVYRSFHTCSAEDRFSKRTAVSPKSMAKMFMACVGIIDGLTANHIKQSMKAAFGIELSYWASYRTLISAQELVRGTHELGYEQLPSYLHQLKKANPGTKTELHLDDEGRFKYVFIALEASIFGFRFLRRVIVVDGSHLTGRYGGVLLVALRKMTSMVIVSDRHMSIERAQAKILPNALRGICYYHMQNNIVTKFKGRSVLYYVKKAAYSCTFPKYNYYMEQIRMHNSQVANYLEQADPRQWSRVYFEGERYNIKTSNIAESVNSAVKSARGFPVSCFVEYMWGKIGGWFCERREDAVQLETNNSRAVEHILQVRSTKASFLTVHPVDSWTFLMTGGEYECVVDLLRRIYTCGVYAFEKIPCEHAIACGTSINMHTDTLVDPLYTKPYLYAAYSHNINPRATDVPVPGEVLATKCLPPVVKPKPGRKKKCRFKSALELAMKSKIKGFGRPKHKIYSCSSCGQSGHRANHCVTGCRGVLSE